MKRKTALIAIVAIAVVLFGVSTTLALLMAGSVPLFNRFTAGTVDVTLTESTGPFFVMAPGVPIVKDPKVTVKSGSEDCFVFVELSESSEFAHYMTYQTEDGWLPLDGYRTVFYRQVSKAATDTVFWVLKDNAVQVRSSITEEQLAAIETPPQLTVTVKAIQCEGLDSATKAYQTIIDEGGDGR